MYLPINSVIDFINDENLGPIKVKNNSYNWEVSINEPFTDDTKFRCGITAKDDVVVFNCFKSSVVLGDDYKGIFWKLVKLVKDLDSIKEASDYFCQQYLDVNDIIDSLTIPKQKEKKKETFDEILFPPNTKRLSKTYAEHYNYLISRGVSEERIDKEILFVNKNRIIFPIYNASGRLYYWTSRRVDDGPLPWLKTNIKDKYPIWNLERVSSSTVLIFEGIMDAILFNNGIALLWNKLRGNQIDEIIKRDFSKIIVVMDGDKAGTIGQKHICEELSKRHSNVYRFNWDSFKQHGKDFSKLKESFSDLNDVLNNNIIKYDFTDKIQSIL